nr:DsrH/TusB family sulfur metabolism protein [Candidatus Sigynarchaeota archaeon]
MNSNVYLIGRSPAEDPFTRHLLDSIVIQAKAGTAGQHIHLMQDGVLAAKRGSTWESRIIQLLDNHVAVTIQVEDVRARGNFGVPEGAKMISYHEAIDVIFDSERILSDI